MNTVNNVTIECVIGNIANQPDMDVIVNAANAQLTTGGGVAGAIHRAAGPGLEREAVKLAPISPGESVITGAHLLSNRNIIHTLGPVYGEDKPEAQILAECYRSALRLAEEEELSSIAFPAISTGSFGYPMDEAARVAFRTILEETRHLHSVRHIRFVLYGKEDLRIHEMMLKEALRSLNALDDPAREV